MLHSRHRKYKIYIMDRQYRQAVHDWKVKSKHKVQPMPEEILDRLISTLQKYFTGFDYITVPAPSWHEYDVNYPIWEICKTLAAEYLDFPAKILFPDRNKEQRYHWSTYKDRAVAIADIEPGKYILVLDDLCTTGHTMRVSAEAICQANSFPCLLAISGQK